MEPFELEWTGGPAAHHFRKARPEIDDLPWDTLDPRAYPPELVAAVRGSWTELAINEYRAFAFFGGMLLTIFPRELGVSWQSHLGGALAGVLAAFLFRRSDPALPMIGGWNFESYLQTKGEWPTPDAGDAFRRPQRDDTPILFVQGDWDPSTPIENTLAMLPWFPNARMLVLHRAQHGGTFQWLRSRPELAARAYEFLRSGSFDGLPIEAALDPVAFEPPREM